MKEYYTYKDVAAYFGVGLSTAIETSKRAAKKHGFELKKNSTLHKVTISGENFRLIIQEKPQYNGQRCKNIYHFNRENGRYHKLT